MNLRALGKTIPHQKKKIVQANIGASGVSRMSAGDKLVSVDTDSPKPDDLIITLDNSGGAGAKYAQIGGALPNHVDFFDETVDLTPTFNFGLTNDDLIEYFRMGMGFEIRGFEREVTSSASNFANMKFHVVTGIYNREKKPDINQNLNRKSSTDYDRKVSNIFFAEGEEMTLDQWRTWFIQVPAGETLVLTLRLSKGIGFPVEIPV